MKRAVLFTLVVAAMLLTSCNKEGNLFIASGYSVAGDADFCLFRLNGEEDAIRMSQLSIGDNPSFFTFGRNGLIYCVNETDTFEMKAGGGITTLRYDRKTGILEKIGSINQGGGGPCHITLSDDGGYLITANYDSGSVSVVRLDEECIPVKVTDVIWYGPRSHPHMTLFNSRLNLYYITDLGLDRVHQLKLDRDMGMLINAPVPYFACEPGSGPRHMAIDKVNAALYVANERNSTISVYDILSDTPLLKQLVKTLPDDYSKENYTGDINLMSGGKKLYTSNRGHNSIVSYKRAADGTLSEPSFRSSGGNWPRQFVLTPSGKTIMVANQRSGEVTLLPAGKKDDKARVILRMNAPSCVGLLR